MRTAFITGANSEIGFNIVQSLYEQGYRLIVTELAEELEELTYKITHFLDMNHKQIITKELNLNDDHSVEAVMSEIIESEPIDVLINVAGINILKKFLDWSREDLEKVIAINATNTLLLTQAVVKNMIIHQRKGNIVFIASQHGIVANLDRIPYSLSKAMLIQMTKSLALELAPFDIRVNAVSPTFVQTEKNREMLHEPFFMVNALEQIPLKQYANASDVMRAVTFLVDEQTNMITGHNLVVDGGWTIK